MPRTGDGASLVQATFGFDDAPLVEPRFPGLVTHLLPAPRLPAKFDLDMMVAPTGGGRGHEIAVAHSAGPPLPPLDADRLPDVYAGVLGGARTPGACLPDLLPARPRWQSGCTGRAFVRETSWVSTFPVASTR
ncbi:hypothetical protein ACWGJV_39010 [Streptomyces tendae]